MPLRMSMINYLVNTNGCPDYMIFDSNEILFSKCKIKLTCPGRAIWDKIKTSLYNMRFEYLKIQIYHTVEIPDNRD